MVRKKMSSLASIAGIILLLSISTTSAEMVQGYTLHCASVPHLKAVLNFLENGIIIQDALYATNETAGAPDTCTFNDIFYEQLSEGFDADHLGVHGKIAEVRVYALRGYYVQVMYNPPRIRYIYFASGNI